METQTALEELAKTLMTPAKSGFYMTKNELIILARLSEASLRVNERARMLTDIFRSIQSEEEFVGLLERIKLFAAKKEAQYEEIVKEYPRVAPIMEEYLRKVRAMKESIDEVKREVML
ncbi:MAG: hypothetical protein K6347_07535 [Campylobacterales bacterium]